MGYQVASESNIAPINKWDRAIHFMKVKVTSCKLTKSYGPTQTMVFVKSTAKVKVKHCTTEWAKPPVCESISIQSIYVFLIELRVEMLKFSV